MTRDILRFFPILAFLISSPILAQEYGCPIRVETENSASLLELPLPISKVNGSENISGSTLLEDETYFQKSLAPNDRISIQFNSLGINIPLGATINGIAIKIIGEQENSHAIQVAQVQFFNGENNFLGLDKAGKNVYGKELDGQKGFWQYGYGTDKWGINWDYTLANSSNLGFQIEFENIQDTISTFSLDFVEIKIHYTELYTICDHSCATFYVDPHDNVNYLWKYSDDVSINSESIHSSIVNLDFTQASPGIHDLCVNTYQGEQLVNHCCRKILVDHCGPSELSGNVWVDVDIDGMRSTDENGFSPGNVSLFDKNNLLISSVALSSDGNYSFQEIIEGYYYISLDVPDFYIASPYHVGDQNNDSDGLLLASQIRTTTFFVDSDTSMNSIDFGIYSTGSISGSIFEDLTGSLDDLESTVLSDVFLLIKDEDGNTISTTLTDGQGSYQFNNLDEGTYNIEVVLPVNYTYAKGFIKEDFKGIQLGFGEKKINLNAYLIEFSKIGDFTWSDENKNGLQDSLEYGKSNVNVSIFDEDGNLIQSKRTDESGKYLFDSLYPGVYYLNFEVLPMYDFTVNQGNAIDSSGNTSLITVNSGSENLNIDAGYIHKINSIGGIAWEDSNKNNLRDNDETGFEGAAINLLDEQGEILATVSTDNKGMYIFSDLAFGKYQISMAPLSNYRLAERITTSDDANSDLNLDYTSDLLEIDGTTEATRIDIGLQYCSARLGDFVWLDLNENGLQDETELGIAEIEVRLMQNDSVLTFTLSDENGLYEFVNVAEGTYELAFVFPESFRATISLDDEEQNSDIVSVVQEGALIIGKTGSIIVSECEENLDIDAGLILASSLIGDFVWIDENEDGIQDLEENGINGIVVNLYDAQGVLVESTVTQNHPITGGQGYYSFSGNFTNNYLEFEITENFFFTAADLGADETNSDVNNSNGDGTTSLFSFDPGSIHMDIDAGIIAINSKISGQVWKDENKDGIKNESEKGIDNITISLYDANNQLIESTSSFTNSSISLSGYYAFEGAYDGKHYVVFEGLTDYTFSEAGVGEESTDSDVTAQNGPGSTDLLSLTLGQQIENIDAGMYNVLTSIGDFVWEDYNMNGIQEEGELGINGVVVVLFDTLGNEVISVMSENDPNTGDPGYYSFTGLLEGFYYIKFDLPEGYMFSPGDAGTMPTDSDVSGENGPGTTSNFGVGLGDIVSSIDAGMYLGVAEIGDFVWLDIDQNGFQETDEEGINGILVQLFDENSNLIDSTTTANNPDTESDGYYLFKGNYNGKYYLKFNVPADYLISLSPTILPSLNNDITGGNGFGTTDFFDIAVGDQNYDLDAGIYTKDISVGDFVWIDVNEDGLQDEGEPGLNGVLIGLYSVNDVLLQQTISDENGFYEFADMIPGSYYIDFDKKDGYRFTNIRSGSPLINSDATGTGLTEVFTLSPGENKSDIDAGFISRTVIGDFVWNDLNKNGIQDNDEPGYEGLEIFVFNLDDELISQTVSLQDGSYQIYGVSGGEYYMQIDIPTNYQVSMVNAGNDQIDNDILSTGISENFVLGSSEKIDHIDIGIFDNSTPLTGSVVHDRNVNHVINVDDEGIEGIKVDIYNDKNIKIYTATTNKQGKYELGVLPKGTYYMKIQKPTDFFVSNIRASNLKYINNEKSQKITSDGKALTNLDVGLYTYGKILLNVWNDQNGDGINGFDEEPISNYVSELYSTDGELISSINEIENGFADILPGNYFLRVISNDGYLLSDYKVNGSSDENDCDFIVKNNGYVTVPFSLSSGESKEDLGAGFYEGGKIAKMVWLDEDYDGMWNKNEVGLIGKTVKIYDESHQLISSVITDQDGNYFFDSLKKGNYYLKFILGEPYTYTEFNDSDDTHNSDVVNDFGYGSTKLISVAPGQKIENIMAGAITNEVLFSDLLDFTGRRVEPENIIEWTTQSDKRVDRYVLERRKDGDRAFEEIVELAAIDQQKDYQEYSFTDLDAEVEGNYYYRLKEFDLLGNYTYSHIIVVKVLNDIFTFDVFPNPTTNQINIQFEVTEKSKVDIVLLNGAGKLVRKLVDYQQFNTGAYEMKFDISDHPKGFYILHMNAGYRNYSQKIIKESN